MTFEAWLDSIVTRDDHTWREELDDDQINAAQAAWESADKAAREDCAEICDRLKHSNAWECAVEIRETIK